MGFDKVVEPGEIGVCGDEALPDKGGNSFCRQTFFQVEFTLFLQSKLYSSYFDTYSLDHIIHFYSYLYLVII